MISMAVISIEYIYIFRLNAFFVIQKGTLNYAQQ